MNRVHLLWISSWNNTSPGATVIHAIVDLEGTGSPPGDHSLLSVLITTSFQFLAVAYRVNVSFLLSLHLLKLIYSSNVKVELLLIIRSSGELALACSKVALPLSLVQQPDYHACSDEDAIGVHQDDPHVTGALGKLHPS